MSKNQTSHLIATGETRPASGDTPSASAIYVNAYAKDGMPRLDVSTLYELFSRSVEKYPTHDCLGEREKLADGKVGEFKFKTYQQIGVEVANLASGLRAIGVNPKHRVGVLGPNCPEWMVTMQACNRMSMHCVPLYDSLGENAIEYIINHSESVVAFVATSKLANLVKALDKVQGVLKSVVYWGPGEKEALKAIKDKGYQLYSTTEVMEMGAAKPVDPVPPSPADLCTIMYTSGTTGEPKGVMLTHSAVIAGVTNGHTYAVNNNVHMQYPDRLLSYLPLAHIYDRVNEEWFLYIGCTIAYWQGDVTKLVDDIAACRPAMFIGVPRVFDRIYNGVMAQVQAGGWLKSWVFKWGFNRKLAALKQGVPLAQASPLVDRLVFSKVAQRLGGKVKAVVSGGAPLAPHVEEFLRVAMCCVVVQGYGLTETSACSFLAVADSWSNYATVGSPNPCTELRLESVPDMNYDALDPVEPKGEIMVRGPTLFSGYYKQQEMTDEVLEASGWFHTGDVGMITKEGCLKIIDRKKNIFKLSQGEYVAVEKLENTYKKSKLLDQVWVYGDSFKSNLVVVGVPGAGLQAWASSHSQPSDLPTLCTRPEAIKAVLEELQALGKADKLKGFEIIKAVHLDHNPWTIENELLTPTFKLKRPQLLRKYHPQVDAMYAQIKE